MAKKLLREPIPDGSISMLEKEGLDKVQTATSVAPRSEVSDLIHAAWYMAFMPMLVWSDGAQRTIKAIQQLKHQVGSSERL